MGKAAIVADKSSRVLRREPIDSDLCNMCGLCNSAQTHYVPTEHGRKRPRVLIVGEAPGQSEDEEGKPFVGDAGKLLRKAVERAYGGEDYVAYASIVRCRPTNDDGANRKPMATEARRCVRYLHKDIQRLQPKVIVALGATALLYLTGKSGGIFKNRGSRTNIFVGGQKYVVVSALHPAYVANTHAAFNLLVSDLRKAHWGDPHEGETVELLTTLKDVRRMVRHYLSEECNVGLGFDIETYNLNKRHGNPVITLQFCNGKQSYVIALNHPESPFDTEVKRRKVINLIRPLFETKDPAFKFMLGHNMQFDYQGVMRLGIKVNVPMVCTILTMHMIDDNRKSRNVSNSMRPYSLAVLAEEILGRNKYLDAGIIGKVNDLVNQPLDMVTKYGGNDALLTRELFLEQVRMAERQKYKKKFMGLVKHLVPRTVTVLATMEYSGFPIDMEALGTMHDPKTSAIQKRIAEITDTLKTLDTVQQANKKLVKLETGGMTGLFYTPYIFDINKRSHAGMLFFDSLKLAPVADTKKKDDSIMEFNPGDGKIPTVAKVFQAHYERETWRPPVDVPSTKRYDVEVQIPGKEGIYYKYPEIGLFSEFKGLMQCQRTFVNGIWNCTHPDSPQFSPDHVDGRVRASFTGYNTVTGRTSSKDPVNNQNIPRGDSPVKKSIKNLFTALPNCWLVNVDFATAEVRWLAIMAKDVRLCEAFWAGHKAHKAYLKDPTNAELRKMAAIAGDIHMQTASLFHQKEVWDVTKAERQDTKTIVFGLIYGRGARAIAQQLGIEVDEAEELIARFSSLYPEAWECIAFLERKARRCGFVDSPIGRRRRLDWYYEDPHARGRMKEGDRRARNSPIQAIASDANNLAIAEIINFVTEKKLKWTFHNIVHDSLIMSIPKSYDLYKSLRQIEWFYSHRLKKILTEDFKVVLNAPLAVDFDIGLRWGDLKGWDGTEEHLGAVTGAAEILGEAYETRRAVDVKSLQKHIAAGIDSLIAAKDYRTCDKLMSDLDAYRPTPETTTGMIKKLSKVKDQLPSWDKAIVRMNQEMRAFA